MDARPEVSLSRDSLKKKKKGDEAIIPPASLPLSAIPSEVMRNTVDLASETNCNTSTTSTLSLASQYLGRQKMPVLNSSGTMSTTELGSEC